MKTAMEVVEIYLHTIWDQNRPELVREFCADPIVRHDGTGKTTRLSHDEQVERIASQYEEFVPKFTDVVLAGDDEFITTVWNVVGKDPDWKLCGIEVFHVEDGRITEVWNSTYMDGHWG